MLIINKKKKIIIKESELRNTITSTIIEALSQECSNVEIVGKFICEDDTQINELAQIGNFESKKGLYTVSVWSNDGGNVPHVHITSTNGFDGCVKLMTNEPFPHGPHKGILKGKAKKAFAIFMKTKVVEEDGERSNYVIAVNAWNRNNSNMKIQLMKNDNGEVKIPPYENM